MKVLINTLEIQDFDAYKRVNCFIKDVEYE